LCLSGISRTPLSKDLEIVLTPLEPVTWANRLRLGLDPSCHDERVQMKVLRLESAVDVLGIPLWSLGQCNADLVEEPQSIAW
tara:strand:+ start:41085 stop:41330 length:246 start_codon:yes stop_codon:yes gene_type:complete